MQYVFRCVETGEEIEVDAKYLTDHQRSNGWTSRYNGKLTWKRVFTAPAIQFKGSGWASKS